ncbi:MAG: hypothetical protein H6932_02175 [Burkholderiaceae bacterium]|nr:hypothetical protein [Burkholderiaceae bacterium]
MDLTCVADHAWRSLNQVMVFGAGVFVLLMFIVSTLGTPLVMWLYRRRVVALMSARDDAERDEADADALPAHGAAKAAPLATGQLAIEAAARQKRLRNVLVAACAVYSLVAGLMMTFSPDVVLDAKAAAALPDRTPLQWGLTVLFDALLVGALCMPIVLIGTAHPRFTRLYWRRFVPLFLAAAALRWSVHTDGSEGATLGMAFIALFLGGCFVALFWVAVARRHARQVAPLLNVLMGTLYAGMAGVLWVLLVVGRCADEATLGFAVLAALVPALGTAWFAWRLVHWLSHRYERKAVSDAQLQTGSWLLMLTVFVALAVLGFERESSGPWLPLLLAANVVALAVYAVGLQRVPAWPQPRSLLLLRVFAHDERGERLLDETAFRWRFIGPIHMIGGPDMAQQTLDPHELLAFIRGRARDQFVTTREQLAQRIETLDLHPDPDRRYRVNELFCFANVWQAGVQALLARSDVVLLDLRGFTRRRDGTAYEIGLLAREGALPRTVCLVDEGTDVAAVQAIVAAQGHAGLDEARVLTADGALDAKALFSALAQAAST